MSVDSHRPPGCEGCLDEIRELKVRNAHAERQLKRYQAMWVELRHVVGAATGKAHLKSEMRKCLRMVISTMQTIENRTTNEMRPK